MCSPFGYSIQQFLIYAFFVVKKLPLYVNFSIPPWRKLIFSQCFIPLVDMRFWRHVPNSFRNKNMKRNIPYLLRYLVFCFQNFVVPLRHRKKNFFIKFECYDLANGKEWVWKFGGIIGIEFSYKILQLEVLKEAIILDNSPCF